MIFDEALQIDGPSWGWKNLELESCKRLVLASSSSGSSLGAE